VRRRHHEPLRFVIRAYVRSDTVTARGHQETEFVEVIRHCVHVDAAAINSGQRHLLAVAFKLDISVSQPAANSDLSHDDVGQDLGGWCYGDRRERAELVIHFVGGYVGLALLHSCQDVPVTEHANMTPPVQIFGTVSNQPIWSPVAKHTLAYLSKH
jgi:hypothetical protein